MTPSEASKAQFEALTLGFKEKKSEISRRSSLTWTGIAGYLAFLLYAVRAITENAPVEQLHLLAWPGAVWFLSAITYLFVYSQFRMIMGHSDYIAQFIEPELRKITGALGAPLLGEGALPTTRRSVGPLLLYLVFLIAPMLITVFAAYSHGPWFHLMIVGLGGSALMAALLLFLTTSPP